MLVTITGMWTAKHKSRDELDLCPDGRDENAEN